jgi:hypothetical protein
MKMRAARTETSLSGGGGKLKLDAREPLAEPRITDADWTEPFGTRAEFLKVFRNQVLHEPVLPELLHELVRGRLVVLPVPGVISPAASCRSFACKNLSHSTAIVSFLALRIVSLFAEVMQLAANLFGPMTAPFVTDKEQSWGGVCRPSTCP